MYLADGGVIDDPLIQRLQRNIVTIGMQVPQSSQKLKRRSEIKGSIVRDGMLACSMTINPSKLRHPLVLTLAGLTLAGVEHSGDAFPPIGKRQQRLIRLHLPSSSTTPAKAYLMGSSVLIQAESESWDRLRIILAWLRQMALVNQRSFHPPPKERERTTNSSPGCVSTAMQSLLGNRSIHQITTLPASSIVKKVKGQSADLDIHTPKKGISF